MRERMILINAKRYKLFFKETVPSDRFVINFIKEYLHSADIRHYEDTRKHRY